jgi:D-proline reductase (dithiol) PrdB
VGLIQRVLESRGIPTIGISINRPYTESIKPPRAIFLDWPFGHPLGEPGHVEQQAAVLVKLFEALYTIDTPGTIIDVGWCWGRETYPPVTWPASKNTGEGG